MSSVICSSLCVETLGNMFFLGHKLKSKNLTVTSIDYLYLEDTLAEEERLSRAIRTIKTFFVED